MSTPSFYVDPESIPAPELLTKEQKEFFVLFAVVVAGKTARTQCKKLVEFLTLEGSPFHQVRVMISHGTLDFNLKAVKMGQYTRLTHALEMASYLDVDDELSVRNLETIKGIGRKTARFIMLYTDANPEANYVPLDTHVLKFLKTQKVANVPNSTPTHPKHYRRLELEFRRLAKERGMTVRQLDTLAWQKYAIRRIQTVGYTAKRRLKSLTNGETNGRIVTMVDTKAWVLQDGDGNGNSWPKGITYYDSVAQQWHKMNQYHYVTEIAVVTPKTNLSAL